MSVLRGPAHKDNEGILNCPYCSSILEDSVCPSCGRICERCGLPYHEAACPECYTSTAWLAGESQHGEVAPATFQKIVRSPSEGSVSRRESEMLRGTFIDRQAKTIHDRVTSACSMMNLSALVRSRLQERAERTATRLVRKWEVAPEQAVKFAVLLEARAFGKQLSEIQSLLASAGFNMRLDSIFLDIAARSVKNVKLFINSERRTFRVLCQPDAKAVSMVRALALAGYHAVQLKVQMSLNDSLECGGKLEMEIEGGYFVDRGISRTKSVQLSGDSRCFSLFKTAKRVTVDGGQAMASLNVDAFIRSILPSKRLPASSSVMRQFGYLDRFERRFTVSLRQMLVDSSGRSPNTLAVEAMYAADAELFASLGPFARAELRSATARLPLERKDQKYTGSRGLLIPSEVDGAFR